MDELFQTDFPQMEMFSRSIRERGGTRVTNRRTMEIEIMISKRREPGGPGFDAYARETCLFPFFPSSSTPFRCTRQPRAYSRPASVKKSCVISSWTSGHLPVRVAQNFANVMTVMRSPRELEKNSKNSFLIPLRKFERGIYTRTYLSHRREWNFRSTFHIIETIPLIIHIALTPCLYSNTWNIRAPRDIHNRKTRVYHPLPILCLPINPYLISLIVRLHIMLVTKHGLATKTLSLLVLEIIEWSKISRERERDSWNTRIRTFTLEKEKKKKRRKIQNSISNQTESYLHPPSLLPCSVSRRLRRLTTTNRFSILTVPRYQINREILLVI